ncbi:hypothetical protein LCGC14_0452110 [marine sediment metagenome]|uniref:Uncharacterized protein n=1 Tax=marine sediment metagenome TaxID=412755 RepID=A0A0F9SHG0_9ZZZZ
MHSNLPEDYVYPWESMYVECDNCGDEYHEDFECHYCKEQSEIDAHWESLSDSEKDLSIKMAVREVV